MYYNDLYKIAEFIGINRMLALVESGFGHNFFNINRLCVLSALCGEISGLSPIGYKCNFSVAIDGLSTGYSTVSGAEKAQLVLHSAHPGDG